MLSLVSPAGLPCNSSQFAAPPPASAFKVPSSSIVRFSPTLMQPNAVVDAIGNLSVEIPVENATMSLSALTELKFTSLDLLRFWSTVSRYAKLL